MSKALYGSAVAAIFCLIWLAEGCVRDISDQYVPGGEPGKTVMVSLKVSMPSMSVPAPDIRGEGIAECVSDTGFNVWYGGGTECATRVSDGTTELYNLWLFQFNSDGSINGAPHKITDRVTAVNDMVTLDVPLAVAVDQTIYLLALGPKIDYDLSAVNSIAALENMSFNYVTNREGKTVSVITKDSEIPFAGKVAGATVTEIDGGQRGLVEYNKPDGFAGGIEIYRLMARVTLRCKFEVPEYRLQGMKLLNANTLIRLANPDANPDTDDYADLEGAVPTVPDADGFYTVTWYVAQNRKGTVGSILSENARYRKTEENVTSGNAPQYGTYVEVWAYSEKNGDEYAIYQIYVGNNNTNNFDLDANHIYNMRTTINADISSAKTDGRIRSYTAAMTVYLTASDRSGSTDSNVSQGRLGSYDFDAHFDSRPIVVTIQGRRLDIGIYRDQACMDPVSAEDTWLRISSSPNYTEAVNNITDPLSTAVTTTVILPTQLKFYLYTDEYLYAPDGTIPDPGTKRTLYVRFSTTTEGVSAGDVKRFSAVYHLTQQPAVYVGRFGGPKQGNQYTAGLVFDRITEYASSYTADNKAVTSSTKYGYYNVNTYPTYDTRNADYGKPATRYLAENPDNLNAASGIDNFVAPERDASGRVALYQYSYYDSFAARYCYDRNRDENGNGIIDPQELKWYLPALNQTLGFLLGGDGSIYSGIWATTEYASSTSVSCWLGAGGNISNYTKNVAITTRCVRDIPMP